jgi:hypothetical protein
MNSVILRQVYWNLATTLRKDFYLIDVAQVEEEHNRTKVGEDLIFCEILSHSGSFQDLRDINMLVQVE